jgi:hemoglobin/transferrin/lactoferrin receptor protein
MQFFLVFLISQQQIEDVIVTASAFPESALNSPYASQAIDQNEMRLFTRSLPESLKKIPSVLLQKTAYGQSSPYIRGLTAYRNKMLIDGIPLNFAAMRSGPNQYWSTVDMYSVKNLEIVKGISSVLYGSDAIGGVVEAFTKKANLNQNDAFISSFTGRYSSAESSYIGRGDFSMNKKNIWGLYGGFTSYHFNDLKAGSGVLPETGYSQFAGDLRYDLELTKKSHITLATQSMRQEDVPRTHKTVNAISYQGSSIGTEIQRNYDQRRDLSYLKYTFENAVITLSRQDHIENRDRIRVGDNRDLQGFNVRDIGLSARFKKNWSETHNLAYGIEIHRQHAGSYSTAGTIANPFNSIGIQGPIADDASYDSNEVYIQDTWAISDASDLISGIRFSKFKLNANRVEDPNTGTAFAIKDSWQAITGALRHNHYINNFQTIYSGISQGFRAPNLSDLTSDLEDSVSEIPTPNLSPERFLQLEFGTKNRKRNFTYDIALYHTFINDMIVRSPTGNTLPSGTPEVAKSNVGDGFIQGFELELEYAIDPQLKLFALSSLQNGKVNQYANAEDSGSLSREPTDRLMPASLTIGLRWQSVINSLFGEVWAWSMGDADKLSFRDRTDTQRIPPGGTPAFTVFGISGGVKINKNATWTIAIENLTNKNYRVHGSGVNSPGFNVITTYTVSF